MSKKNIESFEELPFWVKGDGTCFKEFVLAECDKILGGE